ncbi:MAG: hypothetical protein AAGF47_08900 [Planctomycetota bacterium]
MRATTVLILAAILAVLLAAVAVDRRLSREAVSTRSLLSGRFEALSAGPPSSAVRLERRGDAWTVAAGGESWPADPRLVARFERRLRSATLVRQAARTPVASSDSSEIMIETPEQTLRLVATDGVVGGQRTLLDQRGDTWGIDESVARSLEPASLLMLRSPGAFPGIDAAARRLTLRPGEQPEASGTELRRVNRSWMLEAPARAPADAEAVSQLIAALARLAYLPGEPAAAPSPDDLDLTVELAGGERVWHARLGPDGSVRVRDAADAGSARSGRVDPALVNELAAIEPATLISRRSLPLAGSEIAAMVLRSVDGEQRLERAGRGWSGDAELAEAVVGLLTRRDADSVAIDPVDTYPSESANGLRVLLERFGNLPIDELRIELHGDGVVVRIGAVTRLYRLGRQEADVIASSLEARVRSGGRSGPGAGGG